MTLRKKVWQYWICFITFINTIKIAKTVFVNQLLYDGIALFLSTASMQCLKSIEYVLQLDALKFM